MAEIRKTIDATHPGGYAEAEASFLHSAMELPAGYTHAGLAWTGQGPRLFIAGEGVPAMYWSGGELQWQRVIPTEIHG